MGTRYTGNAKIQGMSTDLNMTGRDYNLALFIFFIPVSRRGDCLLGHRHTWLTRVRVRDNLQYIIFEVPSNLIIKKLAPSTWLSLIMVLWGERHTYPHSRDAFAMRLGCW